MPEKTFGRIVDDYLLNRISPEELKLLRQKIATDEDCKQIFQRKCSQHQVSQYFMVQQAPPENWDLKEFGKDAPSIHLRKEDKSTNENQDKEDLILSSSENSTPIFRVRDFWDFALLSGLICITVILLICWLDRTKLFSPDAPKHVPEISNVQTTKVRNLKFPPGAYHHLISPQNTPPVGGDRDDTQWLSVNQLDWYIRNQYPQSAPIDLQLLKELQESWDLTPELFPHSILTHKSITP